jgi:hypothetical protein
MCAQEQARLAERSERDQEMDALVRALRARRKAVADVLDMVRPRIPGSTLYTLRP